MELSVFLSQLPECTPKIRLCAEICLQAHEGQLDKAGAPYCLHPLAVARQLSSEEEICAALLHDVLEDTAVTPEELRRAGVPESVLSALLLLTHHPEESYFSYVARAGTNPIARRVKLADLQHNSDLSRLPAVTARDRRRSEKYRLAQQLLLGEITLAEAEEAYGK